MKTFVSPLLDDTPQKTVLIILNTPISRPPPIWFSKLWDISHIHICADGGANRLYESTQPSLDYIPDRIRGDLDSLLPNVREYYSKTKKTIIEKDPCQDTNDLDKALQLCLDSENERVIVYGAFGGRFDQEMASLNALYKWAPQFDYQLYLYNEETCAFLIPSSIKCQVKLPCYDETIPPLGEGPTCGLIPMGCRCDSMATSGLKWDLDATMPPMEFGNFISTSNRVMFPIVTIESSHPIVFTAELTTPSIN
jgi:thiamine pyrophosphokinase